MLGGGKRGTDTVFKLPKNESVTLFRGGNHD